MTRIRQIKQYLSVAAAAALTACLLFGCTKADVGSSSQSASNGAGSVGQSTVTGSALAGAGSGTASESAASAPGQDASVAKGTVVQTPDADQSSGQGKGTVSSGTSQNAQNVSGTTTPAASSQTASAPALSTPETAAAVTQPQEGAQAPVQDIPAFDTGAGYAEESFSGEFVKSDGTESVVIALINDNQISFQFLNSGIGSTAQASGGSAVYYGDDGYSISFDVAGDSLGVIVGGEGAEGSVMNGIYYRVLGGDDTAVDEEGENDQDDVWDGDAMDSDLADSSDAYSDADEDTYTVTQ